MKSVKAYFTLLIACGIVFLFAAGVSKFNFTLGATFDIIASGFAGWIVGKWSSQGVFDD